MRAGRGGFKVEGGGGFVWRGRDKKRFRGDVRSGISSRLPVGLGVTRAGRSGEHGGVLLMGGGWRSGTPGWAALFRFQLSLELGCLAIGSNSGMRLGVLVHCRCWENCMEGHSSECVNFTDNQPPAQVPMIQMQVYSHEYILQHQSTK